MIDIRRARPCRMFFSMKRFFFRTFIENEQIKIFFLEKEEDIQHIFSTFAKFLTKRLGNKDQSWRNSMKNKNLLI